MGKPRVTLVCGNMSSNGVTRGILLMRALEEHVGLAMVGFSSPTVGTHHSLRNWESKIVIHKEDSVAGAVARPALRRLVQIIEEDGKTDIALALKPRPGSLDVAVRSVGRERTIVDIDDDELAFHRQRPPFVRFYKTLLGLPSIFGVHRLNAMDRLAREVADRWCASQTLTDNYQGLHIPHPVDPEMFAGSPEGRDTMRKWLGVEDRVVIIFSGTLREHKGFPLLAQAVAKTNNPKILLAILGTSKEEALLLPFRRQLEDRLVIWGRVSAEKVPDYLNASDIVALPTLDRPSAVAQIPIKMVEAMMAGLPVITSQPGDGGKLIEGVGLRVPPLNPDALADALDKLAGDADLRTQLGELGRTRAIETHALPKIRDRMLESIFRVHHQNTR